jgi:hypothetical protein
MMPRRAYKGEEMVEVAVWFNQENLSSDIRFSLLAARKTGQQAGLTRWVAGRIHSSSLAVF